MGFDHPQWEMYSASKHGVRALLKQNGSLPANSPAPRCQDCHMAEGDHGVRTAWGFFGVRLPLPDEATWRADQQTIMQALGLLDAAGAPTLRLEQARDLDMFRMSQQAFDAERERMFETCNTCHSSTLVRAELQRGDEMIREADRLFAAAIRVVAGLYADGVLPRPEGVTQAAPDLLALQDAPSPIERRLFEMHLEHRLRAFQGAFHSNPDHALVQGFSRLAADLQDIEAMGRDLRRAAKD
jgi:cytochrome c553